MEEEKESSSSSAGRKDDDDQADADAEEEEALSFPPHQLLGPVHEAAASGADDVVGIPALAARHVQELLLHLCQSSSRVRLEMLHQEGKDEEEEAAASVAQGGDAMEVEGER